MADEKKILLILDANSLIHRAFHALPPLSTTKGVMVNALYGFLLAFFKAIKEFHPEYIAAAFDVSAPTNRKKMYIEYKAKREKAPDELYNQIPLVKEALEVFHVPVFEKEGFEADDIIGTISVLAPQRQVMPPLETIILSGDADALQLVNGYTKVYTMRKGIQDTVLYGEKEVGVKYGGIGPKQLPDWKGLRGDPSDNIPGVKGVGEKTATGLLLRFNSIEDLYHELETGKEILGISPRLREMLVAGKEAAILSKELATIARDVPIDFSLPQLAWQGLSKEDAEALLMRYEFRTLVPRVAEILGQKEPIRQAQGRPFDNAQGRLTFSKSTAEEDADRLLKDGVLSEAVYEMEKELAPVLREMERMGIAIDVVYFSSLEKELQKDLSIVEKDIAKIAGGAFNVSSPKQLSEVLFTRLGISPKGLHKTPGGVVSTASPELEKIKEEHKVVAKVLEHRELSKLFTTYVVPLPKLADKEGRIHTTLDQFGAATGRLSSSNPNLQNIPIQGSWGQRIRRGFISKQGFSLLSVDYSQMELRLAAHMAKEQGMIDAFLQGKDIHRETAARVFGVKKEDIDKTMRNRAKALNFGILYGMGVRGFAQSAGVSFEDAQVFMENYFVQFPGIKLYMEDQIAFAKEQGYVETLFGRKRFLPDIFSGAPQIRAAAERVAINHPVQGTAADVIKMAMVSIKKTDGLLGENCRMILQIHDELLFEVSDDRIQEKMKVIQKIMEEVYEFSVRLNVKASSGKSWAELIPLS